MTTICKLLQPLFLVSVFLFDSFSLTTSSFAAPPNILFVFSDDHTCQAIDAYGGTFGATPNIDRLASDGMRFDRCYVTNSICGPSRACILTGKYSHKNGFFTNFDRFDSSQRTFVTQLQDAGYETAIVGKWHLTSDPVGFDHWEVLPGQGRYYSPVFRSKTGKEVEPGYVTDIITEKSINWLRERSHPQRPFLLMVQHKAPHRTWQPGPGQLHMFQSADFDEPESLFDNYENRSDAPRRATMRIGAHMRPAKDLQLFEMDSKYAIGLFKLMSDEAELAWRKAYEEENDQYFADPPTGDDKTRWNYQRYLRNYLRCAAGIDDSLGKLMDYLKDNNLDDNTIIVYASDQGFYLGEHGWYDKRFMYEQSLRMPFIVRWPGVTAPGTHSDAIVSNVDFAETFLDMAGLPVPEDMQGQSLRPLLAGEKPANWRDAFYYHFYEGPPRVHTVDEHYGVTDGRHKLIHFYKLNQWELYDLEKTPDEMRSVYGEPDYKSVQQSLVNELGKLREQLGVESNQPIVEN